MNTGLSVSTQQSISSLQNDQGMYAPTLETIIVGWLHEKFHKSGSERTKKAYFDTLTQFQDQARASGLQLDASSEQEITMIGLLAQAFASSSVKGRQVKPSTAKQRTAILSSFYAYAIKQKFLKFNPIDTVSRPNVQAYASAKPIEKETTIAAFQSIDRTTHQGKRDYALLGTLLQTGRRLQEVATLQLQHLTMNKGRLTVSFEHCKGNKEMRDTLPLPLSKVLLAWLHSFYGASLQLGRKEDARPVWVSLAQGGRNGKSYGLPLGTQAIADVCQKYLGTSKVHAMRHTFAHTMEEAGASISEIQARLGHESLATTGRYLAQLDQDENKYGDLLSSMLGIG
jgi:integrase/recombinase XerD